MLGSLVVWIVFLVNMVPWVLFMVVCVLAIRWFLRQERASKDPESVAARRSLAEVLRSHRERCKMTQEFVAEQIGVSRQAVSQPHEGRPSLRRRPRRAPPRGREVAGQRGRRLSSHSGQRQPPKVGRKPPSPLPSRPTTEDRGYALHETLRGKGRR